MANQQKIVYRLVLTGGPCGGKTTGQTRISTFFENLGWKVFRVPETATVLLSGGIKFADLTQEEAMKFQENLLKTMIQIENTFFELGRTCQRNCLIICDRGAMDASAFISKEKWESLMGANNWNSVELRDNRYHHIVHLVSAANGAEEFYSTEDHACRSEGVELARELDYNAAASWIGHPYFDVIDNSTSFDKKINRLIACVCQKIGIDTGDRLLVNSKKRKFLVKTPLPPDSEFPPFQDFDVVHNYLQSDSRKAQVRLRKRGQKGHWSYVHTLRRFLQNGQSAEVRTQLNHRDYLNMLPQRDDAHFTIFKKRRCFIFNNQYYQLDIYRQPTHPRCRGLVLLETYSAHEKDTLLSLLPQFLTIEKEVTGNPEYSMYNLSLKEDWKTSKKFLSGVDKDKETSKSLKPDHGETDKPNGPASCLNLTKQNGMSCQNSSCHKDPLLANGTTDLTLQNKNQNTADKLTKTQNGTGQNGVEKHAKVQNGTGQNATEKHKTQNGTPQNGVTNQNGPAQNEVSNKNGGQKVIIKNGQGQNDDGKTGITHFRENDHFGSPKINRNSITLKT